MWNKWKWISFGVGALVGAAVTTLTSGRPSYLRSGATAALSHGITAKRKVEALVGTAKENISDIVAEADQKAQDRQAKKASEDA
jgi:gas vesicle protein